MRQRDCETERLCEREIVRQRDCETANVRQRDCETERVFRNIQGKGERNEITKQYFLEKDDEKADIF